MISGQVPESLKSSSVPYMISESDNQFCVHKQNTDGSAGEQIKCHPTKADAEKHMKALYANTPMKDKMMSMFADFMSMFDTSEKTPIPVSSTNTEATETFYTDLSDFEHMSTIDGLSVTKEPVMDLHGREVMVKADELQAYIDNTNKLLETTKDSIGQIVGLPIDKEKHDHQGGAGWLVGLELDQARNIIKFIINWTADGVAIVKSNVRRFFSPSFDPQQKVILGGSLTNSPASRDQNWNYLLRPVEMSQTLKELDMEKTLDERFQEFEQKVITLISGKTPEPKQDDKSGSVALSEDENDKLSELAENRAKEMIRAARTKDEVVQFVAELAGGTREKHIGFNVPAKKLTAFLLRQNDADRKEFQGYLTLMANAAVDFAEHGISGEGFLHRPHLPAEYQAAAAEWVKAGKDMKSFFKEVVPELKYEDFNVAEFEQGKE